MVPHPQGCCTAWLESVVQQAQEGELQVCSEADEEAGAVCDAGGYKGMPGSQGVLSLETVSLALAAASRKLSQLWFVGCWVQLGTTKWLGVLD